MIFFPFLLTLTSILIPVTANPETPLSGETVIVGSSTVSPFAVTVADRINLRTGSQLKIETTGTTGGLSLFCDSTDPTFAPILLASRALTTDEQEACTTGFDDGIVEYQIGLSGIVLAESKRERPMKLTTHDVFRGLAAELPDEGNGCILQKNDAEYWSDVNPNLPRRRIEVFGPPSTSGTRGSFIDLALVNGAMQDRCMSLLKQKNLNEFKRITRTIRLDGSWVDAGENDHAIIAAVMTMKHAIGIVGYSDLQPHDDNISAAIINGNAADYKKIASGTYPLARKLRVYVKTSMLQQNPMAKAFIDEITDDVAIGPEGYLTKIGLIPLQ